MGRIGVAYDVFGDGRTAIKGTAHQYVSQVSTRLALERNPMSSYTWSANQEFPLVERRGTATAPWSDPTAACSTRRSAPLRT